MKTVCLLPKAKLHISQCYQHNRAVLTKKSQRQIEYWCHNTGESESVLCVYVCMHRTRRLVAILDLISYFWDETHANKLMQCWFYTNTFTLTMQQMVPHNKAKIMKNFIDLLIRQKTTWSTSHASSSSGICSSILVLYQCTDLTEPQPDAHKYIPLFLPLCGCQLGREVGLFWVFSVYSSQSCAFTFLTRELCWLPEMHMYSCLWSSVMVVICWKLHNSSPVSV